MLKIDLTSAAGFLPDDWFSSREAGLAQARTMLRDHSGPGGDFTGWVRLPEEYNREEFARIQTAAEKIRSDSQVLVVVGIGGSYLGARAVIELMGSADHRLARNAPEIFFAGNGLSTDALCELIDYLKDKDFSVNVISKSGTTTEPALAFRVFKNLLEKKYGEEGAKERIYCTTDKARGTLKELADKNGYECFVIADDVGGRYSVLTAVGLLPIAVAGCDIKAIMDGAKEAENALSDSNIEQNDCYKYAATRFALYQKGKGVEIMVSFDPCFGMMAEWYKQLFAESEGKDNKGIYPSSATFSTDLHSLGQFIQDGSRIMFETFMDIKKPKQDFFIDADPNNFDGLNFLSNQEMSKVNGKVMEATILAHTEGGVPSVVLELPEINEHEFGYMVYFFEKACAISGYLLGVNPFDQPGVESYKKNMFALLGKPGYEAQKAELEARISK